MSQRRLAFGFLTLLMATTWLAAQPPRKEEEEEPPAKAKLEAELGELMDELFPDEDRQPVAETA